MSETILNKDTTVNQLLQRYPNGFTISETGQISKVIVSSSCFVTIINYQDAVPSNGGYMIVDMTDEVVSNAP